ncbi:MAG: fucose isomerase [Clostridia bacterium]|nr:fucose isomerase [Clostridia bacterium]
MLKGISPIISPDLLKVLCEMGHGDRIMIGDGNFPCASVGKNAVIIRCDGHGVPELLDAILSLIPLDEHTDKPVMLMEVSKGDNAKTPIWDTFAEIVAKHDARGKSAIGFYERQEYYNETRKCYALVATGETAVYANVMLQKGVVK